MTNGTRCAKWPLTIALHENERRVLASCCVLCSILSVSSNFLVIFAILVTKRLHTQSNLLLANLCIADLLVGCLAVPFSTYGLWHELKYEGSCIFDMVNGFFVAFCCSASVLLLLLLSIDRYLRIVHFNKFKTWVTSRRISCAIISLWIFVALFAALFISNINDGFIDICMVGIAFISFIVMVSLYCLIFRTVSRQSSVIRSYNASRPPTSSGETGDNPPERKRKKSSQIGSSLVYHMHLAKSFLIIIVAFFVCWAPFLSVLVAQKVMHRRGMKMNASIYHWCLLIGYINSVLNPIIYNARNRGIRGRIKEILHGNCLP